MIAIATLLAVVTINLMVNRVGTIALTATRLSSEVAHFQSRSALTGVEGVLVLSVRRWDGVFVGAPRGHTVIHEKDTLILYGYADILTDLGIRKVGVDGDRAHIEHVSEIAERLTEASQDEDNR